jgi:hypothetical protein
MKVNGQLIGSPLRKLPEIGTEYKTCRTGRGGEEKKILPLSGNENRSPILHHAEATLFVGKDMLQGR